MTLTITNNDDHRLWVFALNVTAAEMATLTAPIRQNYPPSTQPLRRNMIRSPPCWVSMRWNAAMSRSSTQPIWPGLAWPDTLPQAPPSRRRNWTPTVSNWTRCKARC